MFLLPIAIPSYQRSKMISQKTLRFLHEVDYPTKLITIFVANEEEAELYKSDISPDLYGQIITGVLGLKDQRNFIAQSYPEDIIIVQMDDDVDRIICPYLSFQQILQKAYIELTMNTCGLWGVMPKDDTRCFSDCVTTHLTHILGSFFVCRNHRDIILTTNEKEDYERSIVYFLRYGSVRRYKGAGVRTKYGLNAGGLQQLGRIDRMADGSKYLSEKYPTACKSIVKNDKPDLRLNWHYKNIQNVSV